MNLKKVFTNVGSLQLYQLMRFTTFLIISILFTKSQMSKTDIGLFEVFLFIAGFVSFFWVTGIIQSFLSLTHNNKTFNRQGAMSKGKSPEIFNAFIILSFFSILVFLIGLGLRGNFAVYNVGGNSPYINLLLAYILLSNPSVLIEYIYLIRNKPNYIFIYGVITYGIQLVLVLYPVFSGMDFLWSLVGLVLISAIRMVWVLIMVFKYAKFEFSWGYMKEHLTLATPLIISALLSGSAQYIDGIVITRTLSAESFAIFRYGAKEFPLTIILANGLSSALISEFGKQGGLNKSMDAIRHQSRRLMHFLFPISIVVMIFSRWFYPIIFNEEFIRSADVFMMYLLLIIPRLIFPQTILIGLKKTKVILVASSIEIVLNVLLSIYLVRYYGTVGVALATVIVYIFEKAFLVGYNHYGLNIPPKRYIPVKTYFVYTILIILTFVLIDHRVINIY